MESTFHKHIAPDARRLQWGLVVGLMVVSTVVASFIALKTGNRALMGGIVGLPLVVMLLSHPVRSLYLALITFFTSLNVLRIASFSDASIFFSFAALACFFMVVFHRGRYIPQRGDRLFIGFLGVVLIIMAVRGTGLKFLGATTWGGSPYIVYMAAMFFYYFSRRLRIDDKGIRRMLWLVLIVGVVNTLMQRIGFLAVVDEMYETAKVRLQWTTPMATALMLLALVVRWKKPWITVLLWVAAIGITGLAGFRNRIVGVLLLTAAFYFFRSTNRRAYLVKAALVGCLIWIMVVVVSPMLPPGLQRSISFIPGVSVSVEQAMSAESSTEWRYEIWRYCWAEVPNYLLVGRGITFDVMEAGEELGVADVQIRTQWFMFFTHSYHSGPLTLLLDYGLLGTMFMLAIHIVFIAKCFRMGRALAGADSLLSLFALFMLSSILTEIFSYWMMYGKTESLTTIIFEMGVLYIAYHSHLEQKASEADSVQKKSTDHVPPMKPRLLEQA